MAFDFDSKHPQDPIDEFGTVANGEGEEGMSNPTNGNNQDFNPDVESEDELVTSYVAGIPDERLEAEKEQKYTKASVNQGGNDKASIAPAVGDWEETLWGQYQSRRLGIIDYGDYMKCTGKGRKNPATGQREFTEKQIERMVIKGVMEKGWTKDLCFITNGKVDHNLTARAKVALAKMSCPGGVCEGIQAQFRDSLPEEAKHLEGNPIAKVVHKIQCRIDARTAELDAKKTFKSTRKCAQDFRRSCMDEDGVGAERLSDKIRNPKEVRREQEAAQREAMKQQDQPDEPATGVGDDVAGTTASADNQETPEAAEEKVAAADNERPKASDPVPAAPV